LDTIVCSVRSAGGELARAYLFNKSSAAMEPVHKVEG